MCTSVCLCDVLEQISQVKQRSVVLRVDVQSSPVKVLRLLGAVSQRAQIVEGTRMARVQSRTHSTVFLREVEIFQIKQRKQYGADGHVRAANEAVCPVNKSAKNSYSHSVLK